MIAGVLAVSQNGVIGVNNSLPWRVPEDLKLFSKITNNNVVVMGSKTWESLGSNKPLKNRVNVVISSKDLSFFLGANEVISHNVPDDIENLKWLYGRDVFIIGGTEIWKQCVSIIDTWYITFIERDYEGDTFVDVGKLLLGYTLIKTTKPKEWNEDLPKYSFRKYKRL